MSTRTGLRLAAFNVALFLSPSQTRFFDCNKVPMLSYLSGVVALLIVYGTAERVYETMTSGIPERTRVASLTIVVGCIAAAGAGFFTMMTHMCP